MKPKIYRGFVYFFIRSYPSWICKGGFGVGYGDTPKAAYDSWLKDVPKSALGRMNRRFWDWII